MQKALTKTGFEVILAEDGEQGWALIQEHQPDVVLLDIALPGELDGLDILRRIRADEALKAPYVIALTASAMHGDCERFLAQCCDDYISKPIRVAELLSKMEGLLE